MHRRPVLPLLALLAACGDSSEATAPAPTSGSPSSELRGKPIRSPAKLPPEVSAMTGTALAADAPPAAPPRTVAGYREVLFELLTSYDYEWSPTSGRSAAGAEASPIPAAVRELDGAKVLVQGYMQPIDFDREGVRSFLLTNFPGGCCFGMIPRLNEWIEVTMPGERRVDYAYFDKVELRGVLQVGEAKSGEVVTSLYRMTPDTVTVEEP